MLVVLVLLCPAVEDEDDVDGLAALLADGGEAVDVGCDAADDEYVVDERWSGHGGGVWIWRVCSSWEEDIE